MIIRSSPLIVIAYIAFEKSSDLLSRIDEQLSRGLLSTPITLSTPRSNHQPCCPPLDAPPSSGWHCGPLLRHLIVPWSPGWPHVPHVSGPGWSG